MEQNDILRKKYEKVNTDDLILILKSSRSKKVSLSSTFRLVLENNPIPTFLKAPDGTFIMVNEPFLKYVNLKRADIIGYNKVDTYKNEINSSISAEDKTIVRKKKTIRVTASSVDSNGKKYFNEIVKSPIFDNDNEVIYILGFIHDVTVKSRLEKSILERSTYDSLTGIYSASYIANKLSEIDTEFNYPLTLVSIDIDGLKLLNDTFGHSTGDRLLISSCNNILSTINDDMIFGRNGGDEFIIIAPGYQKDNIESMMKKISANFKSKRFAGLRGSFSYGIATTTSNDRTISSLLKEADNYLYAYKNKYKFKYRYTQIKDLITDFYKEFPDQHKIMTKTKSYSTKIGEELGFSKNQISFIRKLSYYYLIGRAGVLHKKKYEDLDKYAKVNFDLHSVKGFSILSISPMQSIYAKDVGEFLEHFDGSGYPEKLKEDHIPLNSRILLVADFISNSINKDVNKDDIIILLKNNSGKFYDPKIVEAAIAVLEK